MPTGISVMGLLAGAAGATILGQMMAPDQPSGPSGPAPTVTPPTPMPTPGDAASKAAKRQSITEQMRRRGRASTILTDGSGGPAVNDPLGG